MEHTPVLYLMLGYPGAGKTTVSKIIHDLTGAVHLWADQERKRMFDHPTHSHVENLELYSHLNNVTEELLEQGKSVIFDTNFNFYKDRQHLRAIAGRHGATTKLIWLVTSKDVAKRRATLESEGQETRVLGNMLETDFERMSRNLQPPRPEENAIEIEGIGVTPEAIKTKLGL